MTGFTDIFDDTRLAPTEFGFNSLTITADTQAYWPTNYPGTGVVLAKINNVICGSGNKLFLPSGAQASTGSSLLLRNKGANTLAVHAFDGSFVTSIPATQVQMLYVVGEQDDSTAWDTIVYGAGIATVNSDDIAGNGNASVSGKLSSSVSPIICSGAITVLETHRARLLEFVSSASSVTLQDISSYSAGFYCYLKNSTANSLTVNVDATDTIEQAVSVVLQPDESGILFNDGLTAWLIVGRGRSSTFQYNSLSLDVSAGGTFTLSAAQAGNKILLIVGNPTSLVNVVVPNVVSVYYATNSLSTAQSVKFKTAAGVGTTVAQGQKAILLCDGSDITSAQTSQTTSIQSLVNGTEASPALNFSTQTNTGLYKYSSVGFGLSANGTAQLVSNGTGVLFPAGVDGNLTFNGTGKRITGDFSNVTLANRVAFQTTTLNGNTAIYAIPNGTSAGASFNCAGSSGFTDFSFVGLAITAVDARIQSAVQGAGTYLPLSFYTGGIQRAQFDISGNLGFNKIPSGAAGYYFLEQGVHAANGGGYRLFNAAGSAEVLRLYSDGAGTAARVMTVGAVPLCFDSNNVERLRLSSNGGWGLSGTNYGTAGQTLVNNGGDVPPIWGTPISRGTVVNTTSGTSIDFTGIPSYAKRITMVLNGVSTNGTANIMVQLGAGSIDTAGYAGSGGYITNSATGAMVGNSNGFKAESWASATNVRYATYTLVNQTGNVWGFSALTADTLALAVGIGAGLKTLSGTLDRVRLTTSNGTDTFDAGTINLFWE